jgi:hypothetical protein
MSISSFRLAAYLLFSERTRRQLQLQYLDLDAGINRGQTKAWLTITRPSWAAGAGLFLSIPIIWAAEIRLTLINAFGEGDGKFPTRRRTPASFADRPGASVRIGSPF